MSEGFSFVPSIEIELNEQGPPGIQGEQGIQGIPGPGITNIEKISSEGLIDTYRIYYGEEPEECSEEEQAYLDYEITNGAGITNIELTGSQGLDDEYTIYYGPMDGSQPQEEYKFYVHNGRDGSGSGGGGDYSGGYAIEINDTNVISFEPDRVQLSMLVDDTNIRPINRASSLAGLSATVEELNLSQGLSYNIQEQLDGKQNTISSSNKLLSDLVDDTNQYNKFLNATEVQDINNIIEDVHDIQELIPNQASDTNQLADKDYVNDGIQSGLAYFDGNWASYSAIPNTVAGFTSLNLIEPGNGNYLVVLDDETHNNECWRYKYTAQEGAVYDKNNWHAEYRLNESPFTLAEMQAIQSGATSAIINSIQYKEDIANKVTTIDGSSTDNEYPSARCVYNIVGNIEALLRGV